MKTLTVTSTSASSVLFLPMINPGNTSTVPKPSFRKAQENTQKTSQKLKQKTKLKNRAQFTNMHTNNNHNKEEESNSPQHNHARTIAQLQATLPDLTNSGILPNRNTTTTLASTNPNNNKKSPTFNNSGESLFSTRTDLANFTQLSSPDSQQQTKLNSTTLNNTTAQNIMPFTHVVTGTISARKKNILSTYSPSSSSSSTSSNGGGVEISSLVDSPSLPSPSATSTSPQQQQQHGSQKNSVRKTIKEYYKIEGLLEKNDEGLQLLRAYLAERRNDEMLIYLESNREFRLMRQNCDVNMNRGALLREFKTIYENFVNYESLTCMNIASSIREQFTQTLKEVVLLKQDEIPKQALCEKMEKCLDNLLFNIQLQFNNEIMTHFKKSSEFRTFVITKLIELSASETSSIMDDLSEKTSPRSPGEYLISNILAENEMEEYSKTFAKKKLVTLEQIRHFTADDYRDKIGMKKIGHLKRIVRVVNEHFNKQSSTC